MQQPKEFKVVALRECATPVEMQVCDTPDKAVAYWRSHVVSHPYFDADKECFVVLLLNIRNRVKGHHVVSIGTMDSTVVHPREVFRTAIVGGAYSVILMHNHPSGETVPSTEDIKLTRELVKAGDLVKIQVLDHVIVGNGCHCSFRELGLLQQH
jgi:DNA repair protein RadC